MWIIDRNYDIQNTRRSQRRKVLFAAENCSGGYKMTPLCNRRDQKENEVPFWIVSSYEVCEGSSS